jgi:hypothetical protein
MLGRRYGAPGGREVARPRAIVLPDGPFSIIASTTRRSAALRQEPATADGWYLCSTLHGIDLRTPLRAGA